MRIVENAIRESPLLKDLERTFYAVIKPRMVEKINWTSIEVLKMKPINAEDDEGPKIDVKIWHGVQFKTYYERCRLSTR